VLHCGLFQKSFLKVDPQRCNYTLPGTVLTKIHGVTGTPYIVLSFGNTVTELWCTADQDVTSKLRDQRWNMGEGGWREEALITVSF